MAGSKIPRIVLAFFKYRIKELIGEKAWDLGREELSDSIKSERINDLVNDWMGDEKKSPATT